MLEIHLILNIFVFMGVCQSYKLICPDVSQWLYRASKFCTYPEKYACLENVLEKIYQEKCDGIDYTRIGSKLVFQPSYNRKACASTRYQPFGFSTYKNTDCVLQKSPCKEEGQVIIMSNNTDRDMKCRCDYHKGYAFVFRPMNICYCEPAYEDCSCYRPRCSFINQDYECVYSNSNVNTTFVCPVLLHEDDVEIITPTGLDIFETVSQPASARQMILAVLLTLLSVLLFQSSTLFCLWQKKRYPRHFSEQELRKIMTEEYGIKVFLKHGNEVKNAASVSVDERDAQDENTSVTQTNRLIRAVLIGKKGVGKRSLIKRLVFQNTEEVDNCDTINKSWKVKIKDDKWISDRGAFETKFEIDKPIKENISTTLPKERNLTKELQKFKVVENVEYPSAKEESIVEAASNVLIVRQESTNQSEYNESERSNGFDYHTDIVSLNVEHENLPVGQRVTDDSSGSAQIKPGLDNDFKICQFLEVEKQADFHLIHQIISPRNTIFVLVIDGTEAFRTNTEESCQSLKIWLDTINVFCSQQMYQKGTLPAVMIVFTKMDQLQIDNAEEHNRHRLTKIIPENMKNNIHSVHFISNSHDTEKDTETIRREISDLPGNMEMVVSLKQQKVENIIEQLCIEGVQICDIDDIKQIAKRKCIDVTDKELKSFLCYHHNIRQVLYFNEPLLLEKIIIDPFWIVDAFRCIVMDDVESHKELKVTGELSKKRLHCMLQKFPQMKFVENESFIVEVLRKFDIIISINHLPTLYMLCVMEPVSHLDVIGLFCASDFLKTPWLCLEFNCCSIIAFNHILAWYTKHYVVCEKPPGEVKHDHGKYAISSNVGVFFLSQSKSRYLVVCEIENVVAVQIWNSSKSEGQIGYSYIKEMLIDFIQNLSLNIKLGVDFDLSYKCPDGNIPCNRVKHEHLSEDTYYCDEHKRNHDTLNIIQSWSTDILEYKRYLMLIDLVQDVGTDAVRKVFDNEIRPEDLFDKLQANKTTIAKLIVERHIHPKNKKILFQTDKSVSSDQFDIKLMNCLLRNLAGYDIRAPYKNTRYDCIQYQFDSSCYLKPFATEKEQNLSAVNYYRVILPKLGTTRISDSLFKEYCGHLTEAIFGLKMTPQIPKEKKSG